MKFCEQNNILAVLPASEATLCLWVSSLALTLFHTSIRVYLYGLRSLHIDSGLCDPLQVTPQLDRVLRGIKRAQGVGAVKERLAITLDVLQRLRPFCCRSGYLGKLAWAVCNVGVAGLFRIGELIPKTASESRLLRGEDLRTTCDSQGAVSSLVLHLRESKTDPFRQEVDVHVTGQSAITAYLRYRAHHPSWQQPRAPVFALQDGSPLLREGLSTFIHAALADAGISMGNYAGFSFRKGGATHLASIGTPERIIQALGRWKSWCYKLYINDDKSTLLDHARNISL